MLLTVGAAELELNVLLSIGSVGMLFPEANVKF